MKTKLPVPRHYRKAYLAAWKLRETQHLMGSEIARRLGLSATTVNIWLKTKQRTGAAVRVRAPHLIAYRKAMKLWRKEKLSGYTIAKKLGLPDSLVRSWIKKEQNHEHET